MTAIAPTLEAFFTQRLIQQRHASPRTVTAYRDAMRLLLGFVHARTGITPVQLDWKDLDADLIAAFLTDLEQQRHNSVRTRNARLAAIRSLFRFAALLHPEHVASIGRVLAIPPKRHERGIVDYLTDNEVDALLTAPNRTTWHGRRDYALLAFAAQTGLRAGEITGVTRSDLTFATGSTVRCHGKGRKDRVTPLTTQTAAMLRVWLQEQPDSPNLPLFPTRRGTQMSTDAIERLVAKHVKSAELQCCSLQSKHVTPHTLRHTAAMRLLHAGVDVTVIALWLGHESPRSTQPYLHADLALKEKALARTTPPEIEPGRYRPPDSLLAFLEGL